MVQDTGIDKHINSAMSDEWHKSSQETYATSLKVDFIKNGMYCTN